MPSDQPFAIITASVSGKSVAVTPGPIGTSGTGTLDSTNSFVPNILVVNPGYIAFFRMSTEATPAATVNDVCMPAGSIRLFANPSPTGKTGIAAVTLSLTTSVNNLYFIPGEDGVS